MTQIKMSNAKYINYHMGDTTLSMPVTDQYLVEGEIFLVAGGVWYSYDALIYNPWYSITLN